MVDASTQMQGLKPVIGVQYCLPSACQFTLEEMHGRWNVVDENQAMVFTMVKQQKDSHTIFHEYEIQLINAQQNIIIA